MQGVELQGQHQFQFRLTSLLATVLVCALVVRCGTCLYEEYRHAKKSLADYYAVSEVTDILEYYIHSHEGRSTKRLGCSLPRNV